MSDLAVVPVMHLSRRLFLEPNERAHSTNDSTSTPHTTRTRLSVIPLVPSVSLDTCEGSERARRWTLRRVDGSGGSRWEREGAEPSKWLGESSLDEAAASSQTSQTTSNQILQGAAQDVPPYTEEEYGVHLATEGWSREETDYLFALCAQFSLRFVLVADRYVFPGPARSVEDLRARYYQVMGRLGAIRTGDMRQFVYDKEGDRRHRLTMEGFQSRPQDQLQEEAILAEMMSHMKICLPRVEFARERLLITCGGLGQQLLSQAPTLPEILGLSNNTTRPRKTASAGDGHERNARPRNRSHSSAAAVKASASANANTNANSNSSAPGATNNSSGARPSKKKKTAPGSAALDGGLDSRDGTFTGSSSRRNRSSLANVFARSTHLNPVRVGFGRQVEKLLQDMGMRTIPSPTLHAYPPPLPVAPRPEVPTVAVCEKFEELRRLLAQFCESRKAGDGGSFATSPTDLFDLGAARRPARAHSPHSQPQPPPPPTAAVAASQSDTHASRTAVHICVR